MVQFLLPLDWGATLLLYATVKRHARLRQRIVLSPQVERGVPCRPFQAYQRVLLGQGPSWLLADYSMRAAVGWALGLVVLGTEMLHLTAGWAKAPALGASGRTRGEAWWATTFCRET